MQKLILSLFTSFLISNATVKPMCFNSSPAQVDVSFIENITQENWLSQPQTISTMLRILKTFNTKTSFWLQNEHLWLNEQAPIDMINKITSGEIKQPQYPSDHFFCNPFIPYFVKWVIPQGSIYITIGDLHGNIEDLKQIIKNMQNIESFIANIRIFSDPNQMRLCDNVIIIFLGDYMDRGNDALTVITTAALLSLKNPGQVLMIRGNHENIRTNINSYKLTDEINLKMDPEFLGNDTLCTKLKDEIIDELGKTYEFLPIGACIGYNNMHPTKLIFHAHACIDPRINYSEFLEYNSENLTHNGGMVLWNLTPENIMPLQELLPFYQNFVQDAVNMISFLQSALEFPYVASGFLWNDICMARGNFLAPNYDRGTCAIKISTGFIKSFLKQFSSENIDFCGLVRGHQSNLVKGFRPVNNITPACLIASPEKQMALHLKLNRPFRFEDDSELESGNLFGNCFGILTLMSATINGTRKQMAFPPTFLLTSCDGRYYETRAIFDESLLQ